MDAKVANAEDLFEYEKFLRRSKDEFRTLIYNMGREMQRVTNMAWEGDDVSTHYVDHFKPYIENVLRMTELIDTYCAFVHEAAELAEQYKGIPRKYHL